MDTFSARGGVTIPDVDVAINIFAKPWQLALTVLSLQKQSGQHINSFWLQYEPMGSRFDKVSPYLIASYLAETGLAKCNVFQPRRWGARECVTREELASPEIRETLRYQHAFENSRMPYLFLTHNDVFFMKDILRDMKAEIGDAFAIGPLGQCWNCPANRADLTAEVMGKPACSRENYLDFKPTAEELRKLYQKAREKDYFARAYDSDNFKGEFETRPWPLPECRVNEWAFLIDLKKTRPLTAPFGKAYPPGAYASLGSDNLDIGVEFFRDMHTQGLTAKHFNVSRHLRHWVGTGNKSASRYTYSEDRARKLLETHFPDFMAWVANRKTK